MGERATSPANEPEERRHEAKLMYTAVMNFEAGLFKRLLDDS